MKLEPKSYKVPPIYMTRADVEALSYMTRADVEALLVETVLPEHGTDATNMYIKWPNGLMICTRVTTLTNVAITTSMAPNSYRSGANVLGAWAQPFSTLFGSSHELRNASNLNATWGLNGISTQQAGNIFLYNCVSGTLTSATVSSIGIGRWK